jgi:uncharacterized membrane protein YfcA
MQPADLNIYHFIFLPVLGVAVGALGTLVGVGGGFILVPVLIILFPQSEAVTITSISLAVVFLNATSGSIGYVREGRVDFRSGGLFTLAAVPASVGGATATAYIGRQEFDVLFGIALMLGAFYLMWRNRIIGLKRVRSDWPKTNRVILDKSDCIYRYDVNEPLGMAMSSTAGGTSGFFGIGGGVVEMPAMVGVMKMPPPVAAATSQFMVMFTALAAVLTHIVSGEFQTGWRRAGLLGGGAILGAQMGVLLAKRVRPRTIVVGLVVIMVALGVRQIFNALL